ncbi:MAG: curli-like amyloid fiber formation chaperone CsgH [Sulfitobacter sp.]
MAIPEIEITPQAGSLIITGRVKGIAEGTVTATLSIAKSDKNGNANTQQSTQVTVMAGSQNVIASTNLSVHPEASVVVVLKIMDGDTLISTTQTSLGGAN